MRYHQITSHEQRLLEVHYTELYGVNFEKFRKQYNKLKSDQTLFVQFTAYQRDELERVGYHSPDHSDPQAVYAYPLKYVIDHPSDIWYGAKAPYLRVLRMTKQAKVLHMQDIDQNDAEHLLVMAKLTTPLKAEKMLRQAIKDLRFTGVRKWAKAFMTCVQCEPNEDGSFKNRSDLKIRSAVEQNQLFQKMGYNTLLDEGRNLDQAVINDREPLQVAFLSRYAFEVVETINLRNYVGSDSHDHTLVTSKIEDSPSRMRGIAQKFAAAMDDRIAHYDNNTTNAGNRKRFVTKANRVITIVPERADLQKRMDTLKMGQKSHREYKQEDDLEFKITIQTERGVIEQTMYRDETSDDAASMIATKWHKLEGQTDPNFKSRTLAQIREDEESQRNAESKAYYAAERAKDEAFYSEQTDKLIDLLKQVKEHVFPDLDISAATSEDGQRILREYFIRAFGESRRNGSYAANHFKSVYGWNRFVDKDIPHMDYEETVVPDNKNDDGTLKTYFERIYGWTSENIPVFKSLEHLFNDLIDRRNADQKLRKTEYFATPSYFLHEILRKAGAED